MSAEAPQARAAQARAARAPRTLRALRVLASWHPRTVRTRLSVLYGSLFLASGAALLAVIYVLVENRHALDPRPKILTPGQRAHVQELLVRLLHNRQGAAAAKALVAAQRADTLHQLYLACGIALAIMTILSAWLGWLMAGRALRPLRLMTAKAQQISERNLHERLALPGPGDELKELGDTFDALLTRLETAFSAQRQFVANASHELRTPLTLERAMVEVALADPHAPAESLRATCRRVLAAGEEQEAIIDALLTLARGQRGLDKHEPFDLDVIAGNVLALRGPQAQGPGGIHIEASLAPAPTSGDAQLAERLIANLVDNALMHNVSGGWLTVHTGLRAGQAVLLVANSGPVIDPGDVGRLLRPFERLGTDRTGRRAGLGLAIAQAIADAHGATLEIRPPAGGGLEVEAGFPVRGADPVRPGRSRSPRSTAIG